MSGQRGWRLLKGILILGSILAAVKLIFVDYTLDEEYQVVMAYRQLSGDGLFRMMWEPHQTSAFVCAFLMRIFLAVTGGMTGVVIFLRVCTTVVQGVLSRWLYRVLLRVTRKRYAFLLALCYFNIVPKLIEIPEFSNLQLWSVTAVILSLAAYYGADEEKSESGGAIWLLAASVGMAISVLAYPSDILLFPFFLCVLFRRSGSRRWRDVLLFGGGCAVCAAVWLVCVLKNVPFGEFVRNLKYTLEFDLTHDLTPAGSGRALTILRDAGRQLLLFGLAVLMGAALAAGMRLRRGKGGAEGRPVLPEVAVFTVLAAEGIQLFYWLVLQKGYEEPQIHLLTAALLAVPAWRYADGRKRLLLPCLIGNLLLLLGVLYMSDLGFFYAIPAALLGILACLLVLVFALENTLGRERAEGWIILLLAGLALVSVFGKGAILRAGKTESNTVLGVRKVMQDGPAAGIWTNYMQAYVYNCDYEDFKAYLEEGASCLIVTNMAGTGGTSPYLFRKLEVSHFSIVDPTSYDERLLTYWELYPEKRPEVIVVDCWYGQLMESRESWIMKYIETEYGYTDVKEGRYVRMYFR